MKSEMSELKKAAGLNLNITKSEKDNLKTLDFA